MTAHMAGYLLKRHTNHSLYVGNHMASRCITFDTDNLGPTQVLHKEL